MCPTLKRKIKACPQERRIDTGPRWPCRLRSERKHIVPFTLRLCVASVVLAMQVSPGPMGTLAIITRPLNPMRGWNSGYSYEWPTSADVLAEAAALHAHGLLESPASFNRLMLDLGWAWNSTAGTITLDANGRILPNPALFPNGLAPLVAQLKAMPGSPKLGVWLIGGVPQEAVTRKLPVLGTQGVTIDQIVLNASCPWGGTGTPMYYLNTSANGAVAYLDSQVELLAQWGVEFVKLDCVFGDQFKDGFAGTPSQPAGRSAISAYSEAFQRSKSSFGLILSPGGNSTRYGGEQTASISDLLAVAPLSTTARILNDDRDVWGSPGDRPSFPTSVFQHERAFETIGEWCVNASRANEPFFCHQDILTFGYLPNMKTVGNATSSFTLSEQRVVLTLWGATRSPLFLGGMATRTSSEVLAQLGNKMFLQFIDGLQAVRVLYSSDYQKVFAFANTRSFAHSTQWWVALVNMGAYSPHLEFFPEQLSITNDVHAVECWTGKDLGVVTPGRSIVYDAGGPVHDVWLISMTPHTSQ